MSKDRLPTQAECSRHIVRMRRRNAFLSALRDLSPGDFIPVEWMMVAHRITSLATFAKVPPGLPAEESADACTEGK